MVKIKTIKKISVAFMEGTGLDNFDKEESKLKSILEKNNIESNEPTIGIFYDNPNEVGPENVKWEVCISIPENTNIKDIKIKTLESVKVASITHEGSFDTFGKSFDKVFAWISENNHKIVGPVREIYIDKSATEIQIPIE